MDSWHNHLANAIALHSRGKHMEEELNYKSLRNKELSPSAVLITMERIAEIEKLYIKADRMCKLLADTQNGGAKLSTLQDKIEESLSRVLYMKEIMKVKAKKWGFDDEAPETQRDVSSIFSDVNAVQDNPYLKMHHSMPKHNESDNLDLIKDEVKSTLKALMDVIDYMEAPTLRKIQKQLSKLVEY